MSARLKRSFSSGTLRLTSKLEREFELQLRLAKMPQHEREFKFDPVRRWRFDFAWSAQKVAVELHGATFANGRHTRGSGFANDREKFSAAALQNWKVGEFTAAQVKSGQALQWLERALA